MALDRERLLGELDAELATAFQDPIWVPLCLFFAAKSGERTALISLSLFLDKKTGCLAKRKLTCQNSEKRKQENQAWQHSTFSNGVMREAEIILLCVRWYLRSSLSYRDLEEIMRERWLSVDHTTIYRWVQRDAPELEKRCRPHLQTTIDSWRVDETSVKIKGTWMYLSRAMDSQGKTLEFRLSAPRDAEAARRFFAKALGASHTVTPRVITVEKNAASPKAFHELKAAGTLAVACELRQSTYMNHLVEQDHLSWLL